MSPVVGLEQKLLDCRVLEQELLYAADTPGPDRVWCADMHRDGVHGRFAVGIIARKCYVFLLDYARGSRTPSVVQAATTVGPTHVMFLFADPFQPGHDAAGTCILGNSMITKVPG
jgi:hypothetical protein